MVGLDVNMVAKCKICRGDCESSEHIYCKEHGEEIFDKYCYRCNGYVGFTEKHSVQFSDYGVIGGSARWSAGWKEFTWAECNQCGVKMWDNINSQYPHNYEQHRMNSFLSWGVFYALFLFILALLAISEVSMNWFTATFILMIGTLCAVWYWGTKFSDEDLIDFRKEWVAKEFEKHLRGDYNYIYIDIKKVKWDQRLKEAHEIRPIEFEHLFKSSIHYVNLPAAQQLCHNAGIMFEGNVDWRMEEKLKAYNHLISLQKGNPKLSKTEHLYLVNNGTRFLLMSKKSLLETHIHAIPISENMSKIELVKTIIVHKKINRMTKAMLLESYEYLPISNGLKKAEIIQIIIESGSYVESLVDEKYYL